MIVMTILLAWINAKYKAGYDGLFYAAVFLDYMAIISIFG